MGIKAQAIKRARIFNDEDYVRNLEILEEQAKLLEEEIDQEEQERKFQSQIKQKVKQERLAAKQALTHQSKSLNITNLADDDDFLFGETIKVDATFFTKKENSP